MWSRRGLAVVSLGAMVVLATAVPARPSAPVDRAECPPGVVCQFLPAAYAQTLAGDPNAYGNYDPADRPADGNDVRYIVVHDTEESYDRAMRAFGRPRAGVSAHYIVRSPGGQITQLVATKDIAFHAGNYWFNRHSIGIEHEGVLVDGARWYTEAVYQASARLVRSLARRYHIPLDREHILGHEDIPGDTPTDDAAEHYDPGPYWDWEHYMALLGAPLPATTLPHRQQQDLRAAAGPAWDELAAYRLGPTGAPTPRVVTLAPRFATNAEPLRSCSRSGCARLPRQGSNVVYLRTAPSLGAPLVSDPVLHPDGAPGTTNVADWSARATSGQSFVEAGRIGEWTAIWFGGQRAWFHDPSGQISTTPAAPPAALLTPAPGRAAIPVYGSAEPESGAYPPTISPTRIVALPYAIPAGQVYLGVALTHGSDYYARFDPAHVPGNHTLVTGTRALWEISFNHRRAFVDTRDVQTAAAADVPGYPAAQPTTAPPTPPTVAVRPGDSLDLIARAKGVPGGWLALYAANRAHVPNPRLIRPGQHLALP